MLAVTIAVPSENLTDIVPNEWSSLEETVQLQL